MKFTVFSSILLFSLACKKPESKETTYFKKYLKEEFNFTLKPDTLYFFLIPKFTCKGCVQQQFSDIISNPAYKKSNMFFITTNLNAIPDSVRHLKGHFFYDKKGTLDHLNLNIVNITLVKTINQEVSLFKPFYIDDSTKISSCFK